jgi:hypothetical protein
MSDGIDAAIDSWIVDPEAFDPGAFGWLSLCAAWQGVSSTALATLRVSLLGVGRIARACPVMLMSNCVKVRVLPVARMLRS